MRTGQISIEYLIITGFVILVLIIPIVLILLSLTNSNVKNTISNQKITEFGNGIVKDAKQMYYLGLYSKKIVEYEVPDNVQNIYILEFTDADGELFYYFGVYVDEGGDVGAKAYNFQSDIPLTSDATLTEVDDSGGSFEYGMISDCDITLSNCEFYNFLKPVTNPGKKRFKIETITKEGKIMAEITPII